MTNLPPLAITANGRKLLLLYDIFLHQASKIQPRELYSRLKPAQLQHLVVICQNLFFIFADTALQIRTAAANLISAVNYPHHRVILQRFNDSRHMAVEFIAVSFALKKASA